MSDLRISIVEDNNDLRDTLQKLIENELGLKFVSAYSNAEDAIRRLPKNVPDVVIMDIHLPFRSGIDCTRALKDLCPDLRVLILTVYENSDNILDALKAGASGYLLKRSSPSEILSAISDIAEGGAPMSSRIASQVVASFQKTTPTLEPEGDPLSERETEVLGYLTKGYSGKEIADKMFVSINTVKTHLKHIYQKLHVRSRTEILLRYHDANRDS
ncbi:MAG: response regulator transcription factor [Akkermansiaceae bacterium]|nr:response regulator transcription factor [Akkermansiaceae bacterium]